MQLLLEQEQDYLHQEDTILQTKHFLKKLSLTITDVFFYNFSNKYQTLNNLPGDPHYHGRTLKPYKDLYRLLVSERKKYRTQTKNDTSYYIFTTNVDHQFQLAGFPDNKILSPQGDLSYFQCSLPCTHDIYDGYEYVKNILEHIDRNTMKARKEDIPRCPKCGRRMIPNVRCDNRFVEEPHILNYKLYNRFLSNYLKDGKKILLLEIGVGLSTPSIIRFPFENLVKKNENVTLVRINNKLTELPREPAMNGRAFSITDDATDVISRLAEEILDKNEL